MDQGLEAVIVAARAADDGFDVRLVCGGRGRAGGVSEEFLGQVAGELVLVGEQQLLELVNVAEAPSVRQHVGGVHGGAGAHAAALAVLLTAVGEGAVVFAPAADNVEALQREAGRVNLRMAARARLDFAMLRELVADGRGPANVRLDGLDIGGWLGRWRAKNSLQHPCTANDGRGGGAVGGHFHDAGHRQHAAAMASGWQ